MSAVISDSNVNHIGKKECKKCHGSGFTHLFDEVYSHCEDCCGTKHPSNCVQNCKVKRKIDWLLSSYMSNDWQL